ncbi:Lysyl-tRNA synthetase [Armadillidium vulgare]|nr:Lysyl-tRNA synthetase [Armadillidium vulgare]
MHDIEHIRKNPEGFEKAMKSRGMEEFTTEEILGIDHEKRSLTTRLQALNKQRNEVTEEIKKLKMNKSPCEKQIELSKSITNEIEAASLKEQVEKDKLMNALSNLPNVPSQDVPIGADENSNTGIRRCGEKRQFDFTPKSHYELGERLGLMDFEQAAKISGSRFTILKGQLAKLGRALINFMLDTHANEFGYTEVYHPALVKKEAMYNVGQLPKFSDDSYLTTDELRLIPTSEVFLTNLVIDKIVEEKELPILNYEAHGKDLTPSAVLSSQICKILGEKPPLLFCYELFLDKEGKKISKSKGNGISIEEWLTYAPTEGLALYIFQSPKKAKRLHFSVIPKSTDEYLEFVKRYNKSEEKDVNSSVWHIHQGNVPNIETSGINFSLLLNLAAACNAENKEILWGFISTYASNVTPKNNKMLDRLSDFAVRYYHDFIKPTKAYKTPNEKEKEALLDLKNTLHSLSIIVTAEEIQSQIFSIGKKHNYNNLRDWFQFLYETLLGQKTGPRMGSFIKLYGIDNTISLIESATERTL